MLRSILAGAFVAALLTPAAAHVTLEIKETRIDAPYRAVLRVPHGCDNSATTAIRVRIPAGVIGVKPKPAPGWTLKTVTAQYPKPVKYYQSLDRDSGGGTIGAAASRAGAEASAGGVTAALT